jgi:hypothetical protein
MELARWSVMRFAGVSVVATGAYLLVVGLVTAVIANPLFERITPVTISNSIFLIIPALLFGPLVGSYVVPLPTTTCDVSRRTFVGALLSFLAVGCPLCNKLVVLLLGAAGVLTYFEPIQPVLGVVSVALLGYALWVRLRPLTILASARTSALTFASGSSPIVTDPPPALITTSPRPPL